MSSLLALSPRPFAAPVLPAQAQGSGKALGAEYAPASGKLAARLPVVDPAGFDNDSVSLSRQSLTRTTDLPAATVDVAQKFVDSFIKRLFGNDARGARVTFDEVSMQAESTFTAQASNTVTPDGGSRSAAFTLNQSARLAATGEIVLADGQRYEVDVEVTYRASISAQASESIAPKQLDAPDVLTLTGTALPAIEFPGSLNDLFKLLGRELRVALDGKDGEGDLSMRLLRLVDRAALLAPRAKQDEAAAPTAERSKMVANSYASASV